MQREEKDSQSEIPCALADGMCHALDDLTSQNFENPACPMRGRTTMWDERSVVALCTSMTLNHPVLDAQTAAVVR